MCAREIRNNKHKSVLAFGRQSVNFKGILVEQFCCIISVVWKSHVSFLLLRLKHLVVERIRHRRRFSVAWLEERINLTTDVVRVGGLGNARFEDDDKNPSFRLLVMASTQDIELASLNIQHMHNLYKGEISETMLVVPDSSLELGLERNILSHHNTIKVLTDSEVLEPVRHRIVQLLHLYKPSRQAWIKQQVIKFLIATQSDVPVLILDSDTFLLRKMRLVADDYEVLFINSGMHWQYNFHYEAFQRKPAPLLDFVTHFSVMRRDLVHELFSPNITDGLHAWLEIPFPSYDGSPLSEYQSYGNFVTTQSNQKFRIYAPNYKYWDMKHVPSYDLLKEQLSEQIASSVFDVLVVVNKFMSAKNVGQRLESQA